MIFIALRNHCRAATLRYAIFLIAIAAVLSGCVTRTEIETYTITTRDTTVTEKMHNAPGQRDNGVVYPTSREYNEVGNVTDYDSIHLRRYPAFLRYGVVEFASFIGTGNTANGFGGGQFGVFGLFDTLMGWSGHAKTFPGEMFRLMPMEYRLRWFRDSPNWTIGTAFGEAWVPEADFNKSIIGLFPLYIRKRFFLREKIPYLIFEPTFGIGALPWQYINIGATLDLGSLGGFNIRAYLGYIAGTRIFNVGNGDSARTSAFPYVGLGLSVLDFVNTVEETQQEWSQYKQSSLEVGILNMTVLHSFSGGNSILNTSLGFPTGLAFRFATVTYPLWHFGGDLNVGTSLFNLVVLSQDVGGLGILPLRVGYRMLLLPDELTNEPFFEYNYYPSSFVHIGDKLTLAPLSRFTVNAFLGYVSGSRNGLVGNGWLTSANAFSGVYFGIGIGYDAMFNLSDLTPW